MSLKKERGLIKLLKDLAGSNYNTVDDQNLASDMAHHRRPSKPNIILKHGLCKKKKKKKKKLLI